MSIIEIILTGIALSMDAFAVAICKGLIIEKSKKKSIIIALYFGLFQILMPILGYFFASIFQEKIAQIDHWIAFILLFFIGCDMILESITKEKKDETDKVDIKTMLPLAIATSIDALAVGVTFSFLKVRVISSSLIIGLITTSLSYIGVQLGNKLGTKNGNKSKVLGGIILILLGIKILLEHLQILNLFSRFL